MADSSMTIESKIKILRRMLQRAIKIQKRLPNLQQSLTENESYLRLKLKDIENDLDLATSLDHDVVGEGDEELDDVKGYFDEFIFDDLKAILVELGAFYQELLKKFSSPLDSAIKQHNVSQGQSDSFNNPFNASGIKLPTLKIEPFDGTYENWADFRDIFESSIHENSSLCNSTKLRYLQSLLKGDALKVIKRGCDHLRPENYESTWALLQKRYDHRRSLVNSYFHMLFDQEIMTRETAGDLKKLHDTTYDALSSLRNMKLETDNWGDILVYIVYSKLPSRTRELWEEKIGGTDELPDFKKFMQFIETRFRTLEGIEAAKTQSQSYVKKVFPKKVTLKTETKSKSNHDQNKTKCKCCQKTAHYLRSCDKFLSFDTKNKIDFVNQNNFCYNCLGYHKLSACTSSSRCLTCKFKHHTLLHLDSKFSTRTNQTLETQALPPSSSQGIPSTSDGRFSHSSVSLITKSRPDTVFPTALINVVNSNGLRLQFRAIIDACSDASYITELAVRKLQLLRRKEVVETTGLGGVSTSSSEFSTSFKISSRINQDFLLNVNAYILPKISTQRPLSRFQIKSLPPNIELADPRFNEPAEIDLLLGGTIDALIAMGGCINSGDENIVFKQTKLGWIVSGAVKPSQCFTISTLVSDSVLSSLDNTIRKFWETEDLNEKRELTTEEKLAERIYDSTTSRLSNGRYIVALPFKKKVDSFSNMKKIAISRFYQVERRLSKNPALNEEYKLCLNDYIKLGHMSEVNPQQFLNSYYLPHHCVLKETSTTTKLRVVFDGSALDGRLNSLNSNLLTGPRLQANLLDLLLRFRTFRFAFTADIQQMYRQIWINPQDRQFQLILWRDDETQQIKTYALNTVTFGTSSAPYLAVKTLTRLAQDEREKFPLGANCLENGFYVDDFIDGADSLEQALKMQQETKSILQTAGFNLRKWSANHFKLLEGIPVEDRETKPLLSFEDSDQSVKTLGIHWSPRDDQFKFQIELASHEKHTKRTCLSDIAKIFDPLGWISPCTVMAKLLIQQLWLKEQEWDQPLSDLMKTEWLLFREQLPLLTKIKLPRWLGTNFSECRTELHGFADASEKAYAAAIYVRTIGPQSSTNLLFAKTKVAPLKKISLPRLELNAAHLLARLLKHAKEVLRISNFHNYYWSDSTITLAWIKDSPLKRTTYVANRVSEIQSITNPSDWYHVKSKDNPADLGTRGILPSDLQNNSLWWHGPQFLENFEPSKHCVSIKNNTSLPEEENKQEIQKIAIRTNIYETFLNYKKNTIIETLTNVKKFEVPANELLNRFSTLSKLCRVVAYCKRVIISNRTKNLHISPSEYNSALLTILRMVQSETFAQEIEQLKNGKIVQKSSPLYSLSPMLLEPDNLLRINSRIGKAEHLSYDQRYPIILPQKHFISLLIAREAHISTLHGTQQQTLFFITNKYHIIRCKTLVRSVIYNCVRCYRFRCETSSQQMAQLPQNRVTPGRPFSNCGVDLAGPFEIKKWKGRCKQFNKTYFAIFICFSTKAVHLEVVVDLSSAEFIATYRRFISRRGTPSHIYSDCGKNFVGAESTITRSKREYLEKWNAKMATDMAEFKTEWHFNPPASPHFGGLWEAGVKSAKHHLKRIVGNSCLSYDEFETLLIQVEACMNSRPLTQIDGNHDTIVLTPAHFLVQSPLNALPEQNLENYKLSHLNRWDFLQRLLQNFWKIWSQDYLNSLRQRKKWKYTTKNIKVNDIVLIRDSNLPPNNWLMGKIVKIHPGDDGLVRVATVRTKNSTLDRPIVKLCPLPFSNFDSV